MTYQALLDAGGRNVTGACLFSMGQSIYNKLVPESMTKGAAMKTYYYIDEIRAVASCSGNSCWLYDKDEGWIKVHAGLVQDYQYHVKEEDREV